MKTTKFENDKISLFESIKPLFANKPLLLVLNKMDVVKPEDLPEEKRILLEQLEEKCRTGNVVNADSNSELVNVPVMRMSTVTEEGVQEVKIEACERLLGHRVTEKMRTKKVNLPLY
ncbi:unnamed protein product [Plutella xylostella]|uniref:(diamondback moth) hypothetical protein n=1 Tax=Plutella xylostella TaxID=51655 RepID=A0A8S4FXT5_PLUXY|nr:unnamed protein product [Plutella xylostella]